MSNLAGIAMKCGSGPLPPVAARFRGLSQDPLPDGRGSVWPVKCSFNRTLTVREGMSQACHKVKILVLLGGDVAEGAVEAGEAVGLDEGSGGRAMARSDHFLAVSQFDELVKFMADDVAVPDAADGSHDDGLGLGEELRVDGGDVSSQVMGSV